MWKELESAPLDGSFYLYGLTIFSNKNNYSWFEYYPLRLDDEGKLRTLSDDHFSDWNYMDFTHWTEAPALPEIK